MISYLQYIALVRHWDRDSLIQGAAWASARNEGNVLAQGEASKWLPWNVAGMAITAICRGIRHGPIPNNDQLRELIWQFSNTDDGITGNEDDALHFMERLFHEQMPYQHRALNEWSRAIALFADTTFPASHEPEVMRDGWIEDLVDATLGEYMGTGFILWASATKSSGYYRPAHWDPSLDQINQVLPRERVEEVARAHFATTIDEIKSERRALGPLLSASEKYAFNPLIARPFLTDIVPDAWIAPSVDLIVQKVGVAGFTHLGMRRWGTKFSRDLGRLFEEYIGRQLELIAGAVILREIDFGTRKTPRKSVDWIVVTERMVVLIEVKASSPTEVIRQSAGDLFSGVRSKLAAAVDQLNKTADALGTHRSAFADVPVDRPVVGLVVTLGNFPSAPLAYRMGQLGQSKIPISFVFVGDFETLVARSAEEFGEILADGFGSTPVSGLIENLNGVLHRFAVDRNPIIEAAWLANPITGYLTTQLTDRSDRTSP
jgi:hypothetical protein